MSRMMRGVVVRLLGKWGISRLYAIVGHRVTHSSTGILNYRESNAYMRTASGSRYPIEGYGDLPLTFRSSSGNVPLKDICKPASDTPNMYVLDKRLHFTMV